MTAPPVIRPEQERRVQNRQLVEVLASARASATMMIEKIIVVDPTTAVPISTGLAVALKVLPAPSFSSSRSLARSKCTSKPCSFLIDSLMPGICLDDRQLEDRLRVVGDRAVGIDRNRHRTHAEEPERDQAEREHAGPPSCRLPRLGASPEWPG